MPEEHIRQQIDKLLEKLSPELKGVFFSADTSDYIYDVCQKHKVLDRVSEIAEYTGQVLLGLLPPEQFKEILENEVKIKKEVAQRIAQEIQRLVFYPVKNELAELYEKKPAPDAATAPTPEGAQPKEKVPPQKPDVYREPIE